MCDCLSKRRFLKDRRRGGDSKFVDRGRNMNETIQFLKAPERLHDNGELFARDPFLYQFLNSLSVRAKVLEECVDLGSAEETILTDAQRAIATFSIGNDKKYSKNRAWTDAYRIELLLLLAEPPNRLIPELQYRLSQAESIGLRNVAELRNAYKQLTSSMCTKKSILTDHDLELDCGLY